VEKIVDRFPVFTRQAEMLPSNEFCALIGSFSCEACIKFKVCGGKGLKGLTGVIEGCIRPANENIS